MEAMLLIQTTSATDATDIWIFRVHSIQAPFARGQNDEKSWLCRLMSLESYRDTIISH
jgi:hypothetical protein